MLLAQTPSRVLIVRLSALGDCVHALPALDALRKHFRRSVEIGWLVEERAASLLAGHPALDRVHVLPRDALRALSRGRNPIASIASVATALREVRAREYEMTIDFQSNLRSSIAALASGAGVRVGFARGHDREGSHIWRTHPVTPPAGAVHKVEKNLGVVAALGIDTRGARTVLRVPEDARERARSARGTCFAPDEPVVALHPGVSSFGAFKRWPAERYADLARRLADRTGTRAWITWGPGELALAERVVSLAGSDTRAVLAPRTTTLMDLAALFLESSAVVGCDTGPVHVAAALGVPVVALYGPKDPAVFGPWGADGPLPTVWKSVHCSPCALRTCGNVVCMDSIRVEEVGARVEHVLRHGLAREPALSSP